jgi:hypothetical protein
MLTKRLESIHQQLLAVHRGSAEMTTPALGREREEFIDIFLRNCLPQGFRCGTGQAIDGAGNSSRQLDIVIDSTFAPSIPLLGSAAMRLYPIESISAVVEVKSNFSGKWEEVSVNCQSLKVLTCGDISGSSLPENRLRSENVAYFAVAYEGWVTSQTLVDHWQNTKNIDCALQLNPLRIIHRTGEREDDDSPTVVEGPLALLRFLELLVASVKRNDAAYDLSAYYL